MEDLFKGTSGEQLKQALGGKVKVLTYNEMENTANTIDDLLYPYDKVIILYSTSESYGHWVCMFRVGNVIQFFDSYGYFPDDQRDFIPMEFFKKHYDKIPKLTRLLYESPYDKHYNEFRLQDKNTHTCGRWCIVRLLLDDLDEYQFISLFDEDNLIGNDIKICYLTENL